MLMLLPLLSTSDLPFISTIEAAVVAESHAAVVVDDIVLRASCSVSLVAAKPPSREDGVRRIDDCWNGKGSADCC